MFPFVFLRACGCVLLVLLLRVLLCLIFRSSASSDRRRELGNDRVELAPQSRSEVELERNRLSLIWSEIQSEDVFSLCKYTINTGGNNQQQLGFGCSGTIPCAALTFLVSVKMQQQSEADASEGILRGR